MAYAAVVLLMQNLEEILRVDSFTNPRNKAKMEHLQKQVDFVQNFLMDSVDKGPDPQAVKDLEALIRDVAYKSADFIDSHLYFSNIRHAFPPERRVGWSMVSLTSNQSVTQIVDEFNSVVLKVVKFSESRIPVGEVVNPAAQVLSETREENKLAGISDEAVEKLLDRLTCDTHKLQVIPILGMGGIGKTTLANQVYHHGLVLDCFHMRAWTTVPRVYPHSTSHQTREMLLAILKCSNTIHFTDEFFKFTNYELGEKLYKDLIGRRYLVVLDNMWDTDIWDSLRRYFPEDQNGSRIIVTTRIKHVADYTSPHVSPFSLHLLNAHESWELLENKLFVERINCPQNLIEIGKQIAKKCQGLPLAIVVVAGLLGKINQTLESWTEIATSVNALVAEDSKQCMDILALSYNYLPNPLKACFLYMGAFPAEYEIPASKLTRLWISEGFIQPIYGKSLEEVADEYLEDLVSRNLVLVGKKRSIGKIKTCRIHDLLRDLCMREARKDNFLHVIKHVLQISLLKSNNTRRISVLDDILQYYKSPAFPLLHSFLCFDANKSLPDMFLLELTENMDFKLVRVLDLILVPSEYFPHAIFEMVHLRYLALAVNSEIPGSISKLQGLQTLVIDHIWEGQQLPNEIWKLTQLRHLHLKRGCYIPAAWIKRNSQLELKNLQTLSTLILGATSCSVEIFAHLPQLRKLAIFETESDFEVDRYSKSLSNLFLLSELETLKCSFLYRPRMQLLPDASAFPPKLKKLTLSGSYFSWNDMHILGMLPNLEVLKLRSYAFSGPSWEPIEGFLRLRVLLMETSDLLSWDADSSHFPSLQRLILRNCKSLTQLPEEIGDIPTLVMIELHNCAIFLVDSARKLLEQQKMMGNNELEIQITWGDNHP